MMIRKYISPKTVTAIIVVLVVLGGSLALFHCSSSPISQENSTHKVYMLPDRTPSSDKHTVSTQEDLATFRDSPESADQAQPLSSSGSSPTNTSDPEITSHATGGCVGRANR